MHVRRSAGWCLMAVVLLTARAVPAQSFEPALSLGLVAPLGGLAKQRTVGPVIRGTITVIGDPQRYARLRVELEHATMLERGNADPSIGWRSGTMRATSLTVSLVRGPWDAPNAVAYFVFGVSRQWLAITGTANPYGSTFGTRIGGGVTWRAGGRRIFAEITPHLGFTDFGSSEFNPVTYIPIVAGIRF